MKDATAGRCSHSCIPPGRSPVPPAAPQTRCSPAAPGCSAHVSTSILSFGILHHTQRVFPSLAKDAQLNPVCWTPTKLAMLERALPGVVAAALVMGGPPLVGGQAGVLRVNLQQCPNLPQHQVWTIFNVTLSRARYRRKSPSPRL